MPMLLTVIRSNKLYNVQRSAPLLMASFTSSLDVLSGSLAGTCLLPPPPLLHGVFEALQALSVFSPFFRTTPFISNIGTPPLASVRVLVPSLPALRHF